MKKFLMDGFYLAVGLVFGSLVVWALNDASK